MRTGMPFLYVVLLLVYESANSSRLFNIRSEYDLQPVSEGLAFGIIHVARNVRCRQCQMGDEDPNFEQWREKESSGVNHSLLI